MPTRITREKITAANGDPVVLVVEDHDDTRELLTVLLGRFGCHVVGAENGPQAIDVAEKLHPDLILTDMKLPLLDGLAVTRLVRSHPALHQVPVVMVTGYDSPEVYRDAQNAGCNYCLVKPIDFDQLKEVMTTLLRSAPQPSPMRLQYSLVARSKSALSYHLH